MARHLTPLGVRPETGSGSSAAGEKADRPTDMPD